jgi:5-formyltetrahydrofolate cyclo-ligase
MSADKKSLVRNAMLARRNALPAQEHEALSQALCARLRDFIEHRPRLCVATFIPVRGEPGIAPVNRWLAQQPCRMLPVLGEDRILRFRAWEENAGLTPNRFGIPEPPAHAHTPPESFFTDAQTPFLVLAPCLAFDRSGHRIGYRGGYYDATLAYLRGLLPVTAIGVAFAFQEVPAVPHEPHDATLDWIITESECIRAQ